MMTIRSQPRVAQQLRHMAGLFYVEQLNYVRQAESQ